MLRILLAKGRLSSWSYRWFAFFSKEEEYYRFTILRAAYGVSLLTVLLLLVSNLVAGHAEYWPNYALSFGLILGLAVVLQLTGSVRVFIPLTLVLGIAGFLLAGIFPGGQTAHILIFFVFPLFSLAVCGVRRGLLWMTLFLGIVAVYHLVAWSGFVPRLQPDFTPLQMMMSILTQVLLVVLGVSVIGQYEKYFSLLMEKLHIDTVTRLPNKDVLQHCAPRTAPYVLGIINIDNFSDLGSIFGYELSDHILRNVAGHISAHERRFGYTACHLKGKEFGILLRMQDSATEQDAYALLYSVWDALQEHTIEWDNIEIRPIYRIGGVLVRPGEDQALSRADIALKTGERHHSPVTVYKTGDHERQSAMQSLMKSGLLLENLKKQTFRVVYQPIVDTRTREVLWYESLLRLRGRSGAYETIYPYLEIAKSIGVYEDITRIVLREAAATLCCVDADVSVNIALADIVRPGFIDEVIRCAESVRDCPGSLILEILETEDISEVRSCLNFIEIVRSVGCKIAIDDFGSGYSNFTCLLDVPVDIVKIDGGLIRRLPFDQDACNLVRGISDYCRKSSRKTVAEYVENDNIHQCVSGLGIDYSQGYLFGMPEERAV